MSDLSDLKMLDLFSGIGGFSLAADRHGITTVAFCECEPYPVRVLNRHWPNVPVFPDVKELTADALADTRSRRRSEQDRGKSKQRGGAEVEWSGIDIICGGFPCQDLSYAGKGAGLEGDRSGLFFEVVRLVRDIRPRYVVLENVPALLTRGVDVVLGALAESGYDALWMCVPACAVGAPHRRDRVWLVATERDGTERERLLAVHGHVIAGLGTAVRQQTRSTPTGDDANNVTRASGCFQSLTRDVQENWPTPTSRDYKDGSPCNVPVNALLGRAVWPLQEGPYVKANRHGNDKLRGSLNPDWSDLLLGYPIGYSCPEPKQTGSDVNGAPTFASPVKIMRLLREAAGQKDVRIEAGGSRGVWPEDVLRLEMLRCIDTPRASVGQRTIEASPALAGYVLSILWSGGESGNTSYRQEQREQLSRQLDDALLLLSHKASLGDWQDNSEAAIGALLLWCACSEIVDVPEALPAFQDAWLSLPSEATEWAYRRAQGLDTWPAGLGAPQHEWEPPRLTTVKEHRANRLKADGNSIVPQVAALVLGGVVAAEEVGRGDCDYASSQEGGAL